MFSDINQEFNKNNTTSILIGIGTLAGIFYSIHKKNTFWGTAAWGIGGAITGAITGNIITKVIK